MSNLSSYSNLINVKDSTIKDVINTGQLNNSVIFLI
jgi:hypothetical protein